MRAAVAVLSSPRRQWSSSCQIYRAPTRSRAIFRRGELMFSCWWLKASNGFGEVRLVKGRPVRSTPMTGRNIASPGFQPSAAKRRMAVPQSLILFDRAELQVLGCCGS
jgi:hypothetical protein